MLAWLIEVGGLVLALVGGGLYVKRAAGRGRALGVVAPLVYVAGQAISIACADEQTFATWYPVGLAVMGLGGALGLLLLVRSTGR